MDVDWRFGKRSLIFNRGGCLQFFNELAGHFRASVCHQTVENFGLNLFKRPGAGGLRPVTLIR